MRHLVPFSLSLVVFVAGCFDAHGRPSSADAGPALDAAPSCPSDLVRGAACSSPGLSCPLGPQGPCSGSTVCWCDGGQWACAIAEADPVCLCGRAPSEGDPCVMEGASCGACCPTPGAPRWAPFVCTSGRWTAASCLAVECPAPPALECPADTTGAIGSSCAAEGAVCGDACCGDAIVCHGGSWASGPVADCAACTETPCGAGHCPASQTCTSRCGPADGIEYVCEPRDPSCTDCGCIALTPSQRCDVIDGRPEVSETGFCI